MWAYDNAFDSVAVYRMKWYAVFRGEKPGVYNTWTECNKQVDGFRGNLYQSYRTKAEAEHEYQAYKAREAAALLTEAMEAEIAAAQALPADLLDDADEMHAQVFHALPAEAIHMKDFIIGALVVIVVFQLAIILGSWYREARHMGGTW